MNRINNTLLIILLFFLSNPISIWSQQIDLRMAGRKDCAANTYCTTIQIKSVSSEVNIGTADFMLRYDAQALKYTNFLPLNLDKLLHANSAWDYCAIDGNSQLTVI